MDDWPKIWTYFEADLYRNDIGVASVPFLCLPDKHGSTASNTTAVDLCPFERLWTKNPPRKLRPTTPSNWLGLCTDARNQVTELL